MPAVPTSGPDAANRCEAARYALLRRLAPSMRHHLVVNLQPIGMIYEVMDRRLRAPQPDLENVQANARKIHGFARAALRSCLDVVTWLAPEDEAVVDAAEGVRECASLLVTGLCFRGYSLRNEVGLVAGDVRQAAMRNVLTAALIQCTDQVPPPAQVVLGARPSAMGLEIRLRLTRLQGDEGIAMPSGYRPLGWADVEALAAAEGVALAHDEQGDVVLGFPWARAPQA